MKYLSQLMDNDWVCQLQSLWSPYPKAYQVQNRWCHNNKQILGFGLPFLDCLDFSAKGRRSEKHEKKQLNSKTLLQIKFPLKHLYHSSSIFIKWWLDTATFLLGYVYNTPIIPDRNTVVVCWGEVDTFIGKLLWKWKTKLAPRRKKWNKNRLYEHKKMNAI